MSEQSLIPGHSPAKFEYGLPDDAQLSGIGRFLQAFSPFRYRVEQDPRAPIPVEGASTFGVDERGVPFEERVYTEAVPGQYGEGEFGLSYMPAARALGQGLEFFKDLVMDPMTRERAANVMRQTPEIASEMVRQEQLKLDAASRGFDFVSDPETGAALPTDETVLYAPALLAAGRVLGPSVPESTLGIFGGRTGRSAKVMTKEYDALRKQGLSNHEAFHELVRRSKIVDEREELPGEGLVRDILQLGDRKGSFFPAYRDPLEPDAIRYIIPDEQAELIVKSSYDDAGRFIPNKRNEANEKVAPPGFYVGQVGMEFTPGTTVGDILNDPILFREYPILKNYPVVGNRDPKDRTASFNTATKEISLPRPSFFKTTASNEGLTLEEKRDKEIQFVTSALRHELQHAIQDLDERSGGANKNQFKDEQYLILEGNKNALGRALNIRLDQIAESLLELNAEALQKQPEAQLFAKAVSQSEKAKHKDALKEKILDTTMDALRVSGASNQGASSLYKKLVDLLGSTESADEALEALRATSKQRAEYNKADRRFREKENEVEDLYLANPGEVEARLTQLMTDGVPAGKFFAYFDVPEDVGREIMRLIPGKFDPLDPRFLYNGIRVAEDITGEELRRVPPDILRNLVTRGGKIDPTQINRSLIPESFSPENKAEGGPVGGLDVYFDQMELMRGLNV